MAKAEQNREALRILAGSRAGWNRTEIDLRSDEVLAQLMEVGEPVAWRALYALATEDVELRRRMHRIVLNVPLPTPYFWLTALASLGEWVDYDSRLPPFGEQGDV